MRTKIRLLLEMTTAALVATAFGACAPGDGTAIQNLTAMGCTVNAPDPRACDPADTKKTTVCHIPPGNPANAHTICVGNAAVPAHLDHGDFVGTCACTGDVDAGVGTGEPDAPVVVGAPDASGGGGGSGTDAPDASIMVP